MKLHLDKSSSHLLEGRKRHKDFQFGRDEGVVKVTLNEHLVFIFPIKTRKLLIQS